MIPRTLAPTLRGLAGKYPVITITGPRQSGKTTLCRSTFPDKPYVNLERPDIREFASSDPLGFLTSYADGAILDEIQRVPQLVSYLQVLVDERNESGQFILTGSQQFEVMTTITQSLAGRTALLKLLPLSIEELSGVGIKPSSDQLLLTGFYPRIYDAGINPTQALGDYLETYVERDIRQLISIKNMTLFERFVRLCAGRVVTSRVLAMMWACPTRPPEAGSHYHHGMRSNLYFWRDAKGNEVDLLIESGADIAAVEIKSGATISCDYFSKGCVHSHPDWPLQLKLVRWCMMVRNDNSEVM